MGASDWAISTEAGGGAEGLIHEAYQHANITPSLNKPVGDIWARHIYNDAGSELGRAAFLYNRSGVIINVTDDISVRAAMCIAPAASSTYGESSIGIGCRLSSSLISGTTNSPYAVLQNGYHLAVVADDASGTAITIQLSRVESGTPTQLWQDTRSGVNGTYQWFHLRLDMLVQPNGDLDFHIFENDLSTNAVDSPVWGTAIGTAQDLTQNAYDGAAGAGFFGQMVPDSGTYDEFIDWVEVYKS